MQADSTSVRSSGAGGQSNRITAQLVHKPGNLHFELTCRNEVLPLLDSTSLNRWAAVGIVERHKLGFSSKSVVIDGHEILYADEKATSEIERILNRPDSVPHSPPPGQMPHRQPPSPPAEPSDLSHIGESVKVSRDGFEFHVSFRTRFGETKFEKLEKALEIFQNMRIFKPHINLQKSGIRLVVTRWDGETFIEEAGIENVEHASAEEVEALIKNNLLGTAAAASEPAARSRRPVLPHVVHLDVAKRAHDPRFHLVYHRPDGTTEEGPLLIRANMPKLTGSGIFRTGVSVSMTPLNDHIVIETAEPGQTSKKQVFNLALISDEDARRIEATLNGLLREPALEGALEESNPLSPPALAEAASIQKVESGDRPVAVPPPNPLLNAGTAQGSLGSELAAVGPLKLAARPDTLGKLALSPLAPIDPAQQALPVVVPNAPVAPITPALRVDLEIWNAAAAVAPEEINGGVFSAIAMCFNQTAVLNEHGFPAVTIELRSASAQAETVELVLAPHYLLCEVPAGYVRFGGETRVFLSRIGDYISFARNPLRGVIESSARWRFAFVVTNEFRSFVQKQSDRGYWAQFGELLKTPEEVLPSERVLWPASREERLFDLLSSAARTYGLPAGSQEIVLAPGASEFIGFRKTPGHGIEFRDDDAFIRFTAAAVEWSDGQGSDSAAARNALLGFALDQENRVCVIYRKESSFRPPPDLKLLRFLTEEECQSSSLNILGFLPDGAG